MEIITIIVWLILLCYHSNCYHIIMESLLHGEKLIVISTIQYTDGRDTCLAIRRLVRVLICSIVLIAIRIMNGTRMDRYDSSTDRFLYDTHITIKSLSIRSF